MSDDPRCVGLLKCKAAMRALRDAEDYIRLTVGDDIWARRVRDVHEHLTDDVLRGRCTRRIWNPDYSDAA